MGAGGMGQRHTPWLLRVDKPVDDSPPNILRKIFKQGARAERARG